MCRDCSHDKPTKKVKTYIWVGLVCCVKGIIAHDANILEVRGGTRLMGGVAKRNIWLFCFFFCFYRLIKQALKKNVFEKEELRDKKTGDPLFGSKAFRKLTSLTRDQLTSYERESGHS